MHIKARLDDVWEGAARLLRLKWQVGAAEVSAQNLVIFLLVLLIAYAISRLLGFILIEEIVPRIRLSRGVPDAIELLSRHTVLLVGFLLALSAAGVNLSQVTLALSALGVGIGFGLQNVVNNFVSGLILVFEHPIQVGDYVEVGSTTGVVRKIGFRVSLIHTLDGADIIIPNGELIGSKVINWSLSDRLRRVNVSVEVVLGSDPDRVIEILKKTARHHPEVLSEPEPSAVFDEFGDGSLKFTLCC
ncbi:MAG: mechanosensitive ion channel [Deltaproteobacteria bacterium]|nr:mechanosensitive ion channel [Deltaproteobacteria bacterium]